MREDYQISMAQAQPLIRRCGLTPNLGVDYTVGVFEEDELVATGSLQGDMLQMLAVSEEHQGEDLASVVVTHLIQRAQQLGCTGLHLFTKPEKVGMFTPLGFRLVAVARPYAALLEWGRPGIADYCAALQQEVNTWQPEAAHSTAGLVMNCNPFTLGHQYLVETAAAMAERVLLLVVEEDVSQFPFAHRLALVKAGVAHLHNVRVLAGGRYAVSSLTFPAYFTKEENLAAAGAAMDAEIFATHIAPALHIDRRLVGSEPLSPTTAVYNRVLWERLPQAGIQVVELPRVEQGGAPVSASRVRALLAQGLLDQVRPLVPESTWSYLQSKATAPILARLQGRSC